MIKKIRDKLTAFFYGRYGIDQLYKFLFVIWLVLIVISMILGFFEGTAAVSSILYILSVAVVVYMFFRVLSKNYDARRRENDRYMTVYNKVAGWFNLQKRKFKERKTHAFKKCPGCKKTVRLKKVKGSHTVRCPLCSCTFKVKF